MVFKIFNEKQPREKLVEVDIFRGSEFACKLSGKPFRGPCPIVDCTANVKGVHPSRCMFLFYRGKDEFDKLDVAYATKLSEKKLKEAISKGRLNSHCAVLLYNILNRLRFNSKARHCSKCGIIRTSSGDCLNIIECSKRVEFCKQFIQESHLNIPEMNTKFSDVFLLLNNKEKILILIDNIENQPTKPTLYQFFGIAENSPLIPEIDERRTQV